MGKCNPKMTQRMIHEPVSVEFLELYVSISKNWDLQSILTPSSTRLWALSKNTNKTSDNSRTSEAGLLWPWIQVGSSQMSNDSSQPFDCIHTSLTWEVREILWLAGCGQSTLVLQCLERGSWGLPLALQANQILLYDPWADSYLHIIFALQALSAPFMAQDPTQP